MKKRKYLYFIIMMFFCITSINALEPKPFDKELKEGDILYFDVENETFDFSKIEFETNIENKVIKGSSYLRKIVTYDNSSCVTQNTADCTKYYTAYCLDGNKKYPELSYLNNTLTPELLYKTMAAYQIFNECAASKSCTLFDNIDGYKSITVNGYETIDETTLTNFQNDDGTTSPAPVYNIKIKSLDLLLKDPAKGTSGVLNITSEQLRDQLDNTKYTDENTTDSEIGYYTISFTKSSFKSNVYNVMAMPTIESYNKALWIIEHSYPTLSLDEALSKAGVTKNELIETVEALESSTLSAITDSTEKEKKSQELLQNYLYATTQYSIWKTIGEYYEVMDGTKYYLGDSITNNATLNKLYQYYTMDRSEYDDYAKNDIPRTFTIINPANELFASTSSEFIYGPYKISGDMIYTGTINVSVTSPTSGVDVIDKAGNKITSIKDGEEIYLKVSKKTNTTNVKLTLTAVDAYVYKSINDRGRLFQPISNLDQIVAIGAITDKENVVTVVDLVINPKTGVEDISAIFISIIIAFTLGYAVLSFKKEPMKEL